MMRKRHIEASAGPQLTPFWRIVGFIALLGFALQIAGAVTTVTTLVRALPTQTGQPW
jgi:hypothetical protein